MTIPHAIRFAARCAALIAIAVAAFAAVPAVPAMAAPKAALVMDMRDGRVIYARSADRKLHPASLTKMMTLYLTFEAVRTGKLRLDQKLTVSRKAARQPASKLYLRAGQRVTVRSLIRATAIKSANDAAMVLAEAIGGSQRRFGQMMTRTAKRLGMKNTRLLNPHGLTQRGHYSTARDMAILARHLFYDFPEYYNIFARKVTSAAGRRIYSTNRLLSTYRGADGIKTGYTRAAGFNLVASAERGDKRIIAVVFGGRSSAQRNRKVARLLDIGFSKAKASVRRKKPQKVAVDRRGRRTAAAVRNAPKPVEKPTMQNAVLAALDEVLSSDANAAEARSARKGARATGAPERAARRRTAAPTWSEFPVPRRGTKPRRRVAAGAAPAKRLVWKKGPDGIGARGAAIVAAPEPPPKPVYLAAR